MDPEVAKSLSPQRSLWSSEVKPAKLKSHGKVALHTTVVILFRILWLKTITPFVQREGTCTLWPSENQSRRVFFTAPPEAVIWTYWSHQAAWWSDCSVTFCSDSWPAPGRRPTPGSRRWRSSTQREPHTEVNSALEQSPFNEPLPNISCKFIKHY